MDAQILTILLCFMILVVYVVSHARMNLIHNLFKHNHELLNKNQEDVKLMLSMLRQMEYQLDQFTRCVVPTPEPTPEPDIVEVKDEIGHGLVWVSPSPVDAVFDKLLQSKKPKNKRVKNKSSRLQKETDLETTLKKSRTYL